MRKVYVKPEVRIVEATPADSSNRRRSQRVVLQMAVLMRAEGSNGKPMRVQAVTLVVNAHGGLLESPLMVTANKDFTLTNPRTGKEEGCRVVRAKQTSSDSVTIAFEFHEPKAQFWPVSFPPEDWEALAS